MRKRRKRKISQEMGCKVGRHMYKVRMIEYLSTIGHRNSCPPDISYIWQCSNIGVTR